jgi:hypothetical protein
VLARWTTRVLLATELTIDSILTTQKLALGRWIILTPGMTSLSHRCSTTEPAELGARIDGAVSSHNTSPLTITESHTVSFPATLKGEPVAAQISHQRFVIQVPTRSTQYISQALHRTVWTRKSGRKKTRLSYPTNGHDASLVPLSARSTPRRYGASWGLGRTYQHGDSGPLG